MPRHRSRDAEPSEYVPLAWCACLGGLMSAALFVLAHDPGFAVLASGVAFVGACGVAALVVRR